MFKWFWSGATAGSRTRTDKVVSFSFFSSPCLERHGGLPHRWSVAGVGVVFSLLALPSHWTWTVFYDHNKLLHETLVRPGKWSSNFSGPAKDNLISSWFHQLQIFRNLRNSLQKCFEWILNAPVANWKAFSRWLALNKTRHNSEHLSAFPTWIAN